MEWYHDFIHNAEEDLNGFVATMVIPGPPFPEFLHMNKYCGIVWCYTGDPSRFDELFQVVRDKNPVFEHVGPMPYPAIQSMFDGLYPKGMQWYWRADYFTDIGPEARKQHKKFGSEIPTPFSTMHMYPISGAASKPGPADTPWAYRSAKYAGVFVGVDHDPANADKLTRWAKGYQEALHPYSSGGAYINFMMDEGQERVKASYGQNYDRLVDIKTKYDPGNLFRVNQNIKPRS